MFNNHIDIISQSPNNLQRVLELVALWHKTRRLADPAHHIDVVHGTSIWALQYLIEKGTFKGFSRSSSQSSGQPFLGHLYCYDLRRFKHNPQKGYSLNEILVDAYSHAEFISKRHAFLKSLGLSLDNNEASKAYVNTLPDQEAPDDAYKESLQYLSQVTGLNESMILQHHKSVEPHRGFLIGISPEIVNSEDFGDERTDIRIRIPVSNEHLTHLLPVGPIEESYMNFLEKLGGSF